MSQRSPTGAVRFISADEIDQALSVEALVDALAEAFRGDATVPARHHHQLPQPGTPATLLLMPAWTGSGEGFVGCKILTVFPDNAKRSKPAVFGSYLLLSGETGEPLAVIDGRALTAWRTAAASALAARFLARHDAQHLVMIGAGALAPHLVRAHAAVRPIERITLWNRTHSKAVSLAFALAVKGIKAEIADDLEAAVREADILSCATLSPEPLFRGAWLKKGAHVDLVGGFTPEMREADDATIKRARLFVDTRAGALKEAGDLMIPIKNELIDKEDIQADLFDLCRGEAKGRKRSTEITLFKSVGNALEDLAAAMLVWRSLANRT